MGSWGVGERCREIGEIREKRGGKGYLKVSKGCLGVRLRTSKEAINQLAVNENLNFVCLFLQVTKQ